ncbi:hypothetical protein [Bacteroides sp. UBA939]|uniref:hypothetical protein n=1 Tax=Bacteroides sp. UBA939 TaxID=1946092 RepID=UPI0025B9E97E|nr:hypothetical protein [Bacteroides sp. UBA939]
MKKNYLLLIFVLFFISCNSEEDNGEILTMQYCSASNDIENIIITSSYKSDRHIRVQVTNLATNTQREFEIERISNIEIDLGYGEKELVQFRPQDVFFLNEGYVIQFIVESDRVGGYVFHLQTYNKEFKPLKARTSPANSYQNEIFYNHCQWFDNTILEITNKKNNYTTININIINSNLEVIETINNAIVKPIGDYLPLDMYNFILVDNYSINKSNFFNEISWSIKIRDIIKDNDSTNQPQIEFIKIGKNGNFVYAYYTVTFYSGKKQTAVFKINLNGEYELSYS